MKHLLFIPLMIAALAVAGCASSSYSTDDANSLDADQQRMREAI